VAKLAEVDMIIADLDRANSRIVALEHRNVSSFNFFLVLALTLCPGNSACRDRNYPQRY